MPFTLRPTTIATLLILSLVLIPAAASGQSAWLDPTVESSVSLEILKPDYWSSGYGNSIGPKAQSAVWFLSTKIRASSSTFFLFELPVSYYDAVVRRYDYYGGGGYDEYEIDSEILVGNLFFGIETTSATSSFYGQFGFRMPTAEDSKRLSAEQGLLADPGRFGAFLPNVLTFRVRAGMRTQEIAGLVYHVYLGPIFMNPIGDNSGADAEVYLDYGSQLWLVTEKARLGAGFSGIFHTTNEGEGFGENSLHQFGIAASFGSGRVRPGGQLRVPLDDDWPRLQFVWGLTLQVKLGND
jgi:hypothetical protein